jgi:hypothetical protein
MVILHQDTAVSAFTTRQRRLLCSSGGGLAGARRGTSPRAPRKCGAPAPTDRHWRSQCRDSASSRVPLCARTTRAPSLEPALRPPPPPPDRRLVVDDKWATTRGSPPLLGVRSVRQNVPRVKGRFGVRTPSWVEHGLGAVCSPCRKAEACLHVGTQKCPARKLLTCHTLCAKIWQIPVDCIGRGSWGIENWNPKSPSILVI